MIFKNKHYLNWLKDMKTLINKNKKFIQNNSISKINITDNRFYKFIIWVLYQIYALIKHLLTFNYTKARLGIVKYFTIFITALLWGFILFLIYANGITTITSYLNYIKNILSPLLESLNQNPQLEEGLHNYLENFKSFFEYLDDYFIDTSIDSNLNDGPDNYDIRPRIKNIPNVGDTNVPATSDIGKYALMGLGLAIFVICIYYGVDYLITTYYGGQPWNNIQESEVIPSDSSSSGLLREQITTVNSSPSSSGSSTPIATPNMNTSLPTSPIITPSNDNVEINTTFSNE